MLHCPVISYSHHLHSSWLLIKSSSAHDRDHRNISAKAYVLQNAFMVARFKETHSWKFLNSDFSWITIRDLFHHNTLFATCVICTHFLLRNPRTFMFRPHWSPECPQIEKGQGWSANLTQIITFYKWRPHSTNCWISLPQGTHTQNINYQDSIDVLLKHWVSIKDWEEKEAKLIAHGGNYQATFLPSCN